MPAAVPPFVPPAFEVPLRLEHPCFTLRPLRIGDVVKDFDAVMSSVTQLRSVFGPGSDWPSAQLTFEQDLVDLGWHHKEFQRRTSFAYTVVDPAETLCLGCTYLYPTSVAGYDAEAYCWVRASHQAQLDASLFGTFKGWLADRWPFRCVAFPGREPDWTEWQRAVAAGRVL
jgi:hypothetical protein